jgi:hypothetical protein
LGAILRSALLAVQLILEGGSPPISVVAGAHNYYDPDDGTPPIKNTGLTGTVPPMTTVHLRNIDMPTLLGDSFKQCCYLLRLRVYDATIRHSFNGRFAWPIESHRTETITTFQAG